MENLIVIISSRSSKINTAFLGSSILTPRLSLGIPRRLHTISAFMASLRGGMEGCKRAVKTLFFLVNLLASLMVPSLPVLLAMLDVGIPGILLTTVVHSSLDHHSYAFTTSLFDVLLVSALRSSLILCAYTFGGIKSGVYFIITLVFVACSVAVMAVKACAYVPSSSSSTIDNLGVAMLFASSFLCALGHGVSAYRTSCQAKKKSFLLGDEQLSFFCRYTVRLKEKRFRSAAFFKKIGGKDDEFPVCAGDINSQFMLCRGLHLHYNLFPKEELWKQERTKPNWSRQPLSSFPATRSSGAYTFFPSLRTPLLNSSSFNGWSTEQYIDLEASGAKSNAGVVLVHGFGGGVFSWRRVIGPLAREAGCSVASFDRPGWGLTSRPNKNDDDHSPNSYDLHSQVDLLLDFCKELGFDSVVLVGHDDGGVLALMAAGKVMSQSSDAQVVVRGVVLIGVSSSREIIPAFPRVLLHTSLGKNMLRPLLCSDMTSRHAWHDASRLTSEVMNLYKVPLDVECWNQTESRTVSNITPELLRTVQNIPTLLVAGMQDMLVPLQAVQALASQLSSSKLVAIPRCGHLPPEECPGPLLAALVPFVKETLTTSTMT